MSKPLRHEILDAESQVEDIKKAYLRRWGWNYTSSMPGSYWLWRRDFSDIDAKLIERDTRCGFPTIHKPWGTITAETDMAVLMTASVIDDHEETDEQPGA